VKCGCDGFFVAMRKLSLGAVSAVVVIISVACSAVRHSGAELVPPPLQYCEIANHPEKYDGQRVRVIATLYFMMHGYKFMDRDCPGDEKETAVLLNGAHEAKLARETGADEYNPWSFPKIIATGKFSRVKPSRKSDSVADNSDLIFEMDEVEGIIK
jgi:hypothetical protein